MVAQEENEYEWEPFWSPFGLPEKQAIEIVEPDHHENHIQIDQMHHRMEEQIECPRSKTSNYCLANQLKYNVNS